MSERKRSANWLLPEKMLLLDLVTEHFSIIENKKTDGVTMKQKNAEWIKISDEFNSQTTNHHRTAENLKSQWESLKKATKKVASSARQSLMQTGGGPAKPKDTDPIHEKIMGLISTSAVGLSNKFDSDSIIVIHNNGTDENCQSESTHAKVSVPDVSDVYIPISTVNLDPCITSQDDNIMEVTTDWGDYTPKMLQTPISTPLRLESKDNIAVCPLPDEEITISKNIMKTPKLKLKPWSSKRRPTPPYRSASDTLEELHRKKIKALDMQMNFAKTEREEAKKLFGVDLDIKKEILKQEKVKTMLLLAQLREKRKEKNKSLE